MAEARPLIQTFFLAVVVVLFIACANLAGLFLVRVIRRRREISVRLALGAGPETILRSYLVEALVLSTSGGILGLALAAFALRVGVKLLPETLPRTGSISLDWHVVWFALGLSVLTGLFCGLVPAFTAARTGVSEALKEGGRTGSASRGHARLRSALVIAELAVALVLLSASGLLLRSFEKMREIDLGFRVDHVLTASFSLPRGRYSTQNAINAFQASLQDRLQQLPGVIAAGTTSVLPASGVGGMAVFTPEGYVPPNGSGLNLAWMPEVTGDYFRAQGIQILRGRAFTMADKDGSPLVVIVSRGLAEHYWPGQDPIGKRVHRGPKEATALPWLTVVGEIDGVKQLSDLPAKQEIYVPATQAKTDAGTLASPDMLAGDSGSIVMRSQVPPAQLADALQASVRSIDPQLPVTNIASMDQIVSEDQAPRRFNTVLISAFAAAAVLLALLGVYSVVAFSTATRNQEMAIRLALGSGRPSIMGLILTSGAKLGLAGCGVGFVAALFAMRLMRSLVFQVNVLDPAVLAFSTLVVFLITVLASIVPASRAASVEPVKALRDA